MPAAPGGETDRTVVTVVTAADVGIAVIEGIASSAPRAVTVRARIQTTCSPTGA